MFHWLRSQASTAGDKGSIPGWGTKTPHALWTGQKIQKKIFFLKNEDKQEPPPTFLS